MLSAHTGALLADARCSLLVGEPGKGDPLTYPRMAISCTGVRLQAGTPEQERARRRYLNRHPKANLYAGFSDFFFLRLEPLRASLIGGFGKAYLLDRPDLLVTDTAAVLSLAEAEQAAIVHMNEEHRKSIGIYAKAFIGAGGDGWKITGIDPDGLDLASGSAIGRVFSGTADRRRRPAKDPGGSGSFRAPRSVGKACLEHRSEIGIDFREERCVNLKT